ncbi:MAG: hypothetical protein ABF679_07980 [Lentilactobacillus diolivorans]|uniref:Integral membrane protein n=1 Tax=Lentilactobacillus diolivorans TaxID=179838 RepID=A0ABQ0XLQ6_9LACO|nr:hypothetical protein [Lentilactobacillus diolivorans]MDH5104496.1 hypothetical protein [Lentilactobacillus diolivorans]RRG02760.1 MAG: hypothetical protein DUD34_07755 [Lactobacillus sp.]GEP24330.1 hypothetical protein LDI01_19230 [Lentilactobacillus diolivorans]
MRVEEKKVITWAIVSLVVFLITNWLLTLKMMQLDKAVHMSEAIQVTWIAIAFYAATIILAVLKVKISYYLLAVVVAVYSVGFVGMLMTMINDSSANYLVRALPIVMSAIGIWVNVYWYILVFRLRAVYQRKSMKKQLEKRAKEFKK